MAQNDSKYLPELMAEKDSIDPSFEHAVRLITQEIENIKNPKSKNAGKSDIPKKDMLDVSGKPQKVECDIMVPADRYPSVNFVGRLIGPGGSTMKGIQELTSTKMAVLGKGSVRERDRKKFEELKDKDEKYAHLNYPLHVHISAFGPVPQAFVNLGRAAAEIQKLLVVDETTESQFGVQAVIAQQAMRGRGRGGSARGGGRGSGVGQNSRGGGFQQQRGGRGGGSAQRGSGRGGGPSSRGGRGRGRGQSQQFSQMSQSVGADSYGDDFGFDSFGGGTSFDQSYEGYGDSFDASYGDGSFGADAYGGDASYTEDYFGQDSYGDGFGNGAAANSGVNFGGQGSFRGKMRGGGGRGRQKPY